jgi:hypothetical protein
MNRKKDATVFDATFVELRFILRNSESDERTSNAKDGPRNSRTSQSSHDGASRDKRS